jgi:uncharacterized peroxidase-related enzyme
MTDHARHRTPHPVRCLLHASIEIVVWIRTIPWDESEGALRAAYDWQASRLGEPAEFTMLGSLYPEVVEERLRLYRVVEGCPSELTVEERVLAAFVTSMLNGTAHCASGLRHRLAALGWPPVQVAAIEDDPTAVRTGSARLDAVAAYAAKLTTEPTAMRVDDIDALRSIGLGDLEVLDLNNVVAYYNYINRVANGLGLTTTLTPHDALHALPDEQAS